MIDDLLAWVRAAGARCDGLTVGPVPDAQGGRQGVFSIARDVTELRDSLAVLSRSQLALAEAYRNVAVTGATPTAITDCLNFGSPENPEVMWQFGQTVDGLADGCYDLGIPVTGSDPLALAVSLDKDMTRRVVEAAGLTVPKGFTIPPPPRRLWAWAWGKRRSKPPPIR